MNNLKHKYIGLRHFIKVPLILFCLAIQFSALHAQNLYTNASGGNATAPNTAVSIASALTVGTIETPTPLTAATVSISSNFVTLQDVLKINGLTSGTDGSISFSYNGTTGVMSLTGAATEAQYQSTFRKITYTNTAASPNANVRTVTFSLNAALPYSGNGHYYEYISGGSNITWAAARDAAAASGNKYFGLQGYLVTSTSAGENSFISSKLNGAQGWLGASDAAVEGEWRWVTGPEAGTQFWSNLSGGLVVGGNYANWNGGEPNNSSDEDYGQFVPSGMWNDLPNAGTITGYVVEYGGMAGDPVIHISDVVSVNVVYNPTSITASAATICNGYRTTLTAQGAMGTVYWYTGSCDGTEIGSGNSITVSPIATTTYYARNYNNSQFSEGCASITITVNQPSFTPSLTVASLAGAVTGENIKWYADAEGGSPLENSASISNRSTYHASQTVNGIESIARKAVTVNIATTPCKPTGSASQTFASGTTVADLLATGNLIRWYTTLSGGSTLPANTVLTPGIYYATQTIDCTESTERLAVTVTVTIN